MGFGGIAIPRALDPTPVSWSHWRVSPCNPLPPPCDGETRLRCWEGQEAPGGWGSLLLLLKGEGCWPEHRSQMWVEASGRLASLCLCPPHSPSASPRLETASPFPAQQTPRDPLRGAQAQGPCRPGSAGTAGPPQALGPNSVQARRPHNPQ